MYKPHLSQVKIHSQIKTYKMKKLILFIALAVFTLQSQAQKLMAKEVPAAVTTAFYKSYPTIKDVSWNKEGLLYQGAYVSDKVDKSATYDVTGKLINTQMEIVGTALPGTAMNYVKLNYKEDEVNSASKITDANNVVTYSAEVKGMELTFDSKGNFINSIKK
jgi:hypothetical protein